MSTEAPSVDRPQSGVSRRSFVTWSAALGGGGALVASNAHFLGMPATDSVAVAVEGIKDAKTTWSACIVNCGSRCPLRLQVVDGQIKRVLPDNTGDDSLLGRQIRACVRGRNMRQRVYNPSRIKKPLKRREGTKRGEGVWDEISWDEAFQLYADELKRVIKEHGNEACFMVYGSGVWNAHVSAGALPKRIFNLMGGQLNYYGNYSFSQLGTITRFHYGMEGECPSNSIENTVLHSKMWVLWGHNPQETRMSGGGNLWTSLQAAKKDGLHIAVVDPRQSDSVTVLADEWIAPRPGTDAALVAGIIKHILDNNLQDQEFLDKYCVGFDEKTMPDGVPANLSYRSYLEGKGEDGIEKTPEWAAEITGVPADRIRDFATRLAITKPVNIVQGWGPQRHANGENQVRAIYTLAAVLGQVGIPGGGTGGQEGYLWPKTPWISAGENPIPDAISNFGWSNAIDHGEEMTATKDGVRGTDRLKTGIKFMVEFGGNMLASQHADNGKLRKLLQDDSKCEFICVIDNQFT
uniref:molybdopterin-dependent oxidoreductase n=1 Tax=uncultured Tessaracoccus sp. TaxID=905023 RepID=UPI00261EEBDF